MISKIFQWNPKIYVKIERISPRAIKKVDGDPPKSWPQFWQFWTLDDCNVSCWADGTNLIINFESWALGLSEESRSPKRQPKKIAEKKSVISACWLQAFKTIKAFILWTRKYRVEKIDNNMNSQDKSGNFKNMIVILYPVFLYNYPATALLT